MRQYAYDLVAECVTVTFAQDGALRRLRFVRPSPPKTTFRLTEAAGMTVFDVVYRQMERQKVRVEFYADYSLHDFLAESVEEIEQV